MLALDVWDGIWSEWHCCHGLVPMGAPLRTGHRTLSTARALLPSAGWSQQQAAATPRTVLSVPSCEESCPLQIFPASGLSWFITPWLV